MARPRARGDNKGSGNRRTPMASNHNAGDRKKEQHRRPNQHRKHRSHAGREAIAGRRQPRAGSRARAIDGRFNSTTDPRAHRAEQRFAEHVGANPHQRRIDRGKCRGGDPGAGSCRPSRDDANQPDTDRADDRLRDLDLRRASPRSRRGRRRWREKERVSGGPAELLRRVSLPPRGRS